MLEVLLTFDVEVWCRSWSTLDDSFPGSFARYVYGRSRHGEFALPKTLELLNRNRLHGIFFVEPLFAARFGIENLHAIVDIIAAGGHEVQMHLHPEWTDEIVPPPIPNVSRKRQYLNSYTQDEQTALVHLGIELLERAGASRPIAFRAGSFAANKETFASLRANDIRIDSSIDCTVSESVPDMRDGRDLLTAQTIDGVLCLPLSVFQDGLGKRRHAQVGACSSWEMIEAMEAADRAGWDHFVVLSHNFEMLKPGSSLPDKIVADRFRQLCEYLGKNREQFPTASFLSFQPLAQRSVNTVLRVSTSATIRRHFEQALRRLT